jgi:hypothetical protein
VETDSSQVEEEEVSVIFSSGNIGLIVIPTKGLTNMESFHNHHWQQ